VLKFMGRTLARLPLTCQTGALDRGLEGDLWISASSFGGSSDLFPPLWPSAVTFQHALPAAVGMGRNDSNHHICVYMLYKQILLIMHSRVFHSPNNLCCRGSGGVSSALGIARTPI